MIEILVLLGMYFEAVVVFVTIFLILLRFALVILYIYTLFICFFRMGNTKILERYECDYLRDAAIAVTKITTGREPAPMKPIYGERALDVSFDFGGIAGGQRWSMDAGK